MPERLLLQHLRPYAGRYALGCGFLALASLCALAIPWMVKRAIEALEAGSAAGELQGYVAIILALAAAHGLVRLGSRFAILGGGQAVEFDLRNTLYGHLQKLSLGFYQTHRTGDLMSRASNDLSAVKLLVGFGALSLMATTITFVGTLVAMLAIDPRLTLYAMAPYPLLILLAKRFNSTVHRQSQAVQEQLGALSAQAHENLTGMTVVRAYTMEAGELRHFQRLNAEYLARSLRLARTQAAFSPLLGLIAGIGTLTILWIGGAAVAEKRITLGSFVAFNAYLAHLAWPTIALGWTLSVVRRGLAAMGRIAEILSVEPEFRDAADAVEIAPHVRNAAIEFRNLSFAYEGRGPALRNVTLTIPAGSTLAVVGPTGSGKSTLGALVPRLIDPPPGTLFIGGRDVRGIRLESLRRAVGYVPQDPFLFSRSLRENLALADDAADGKRLAEVARVAGLAEEIEGFLHGWETVVGERGLTVSGGQRQRAALARALLADPPILILDDAFANVDAAKEMEILHALSQVLRGRTTLIITHRLKAAREADWIVVLGEGRIVEQGPHDALIERGGLYARLWRIQQLEEEISRA
ncbi:MAG: ABC transporter ATP-binding protein [Candidatus Rokubacteria bacterium]|nr:ABC transporter ATP-binding protein [Candidatus Rokubacteria bacterium]